MLRTVLVLTRFFPLPFVPLFLLGTLAPAPTPPFLSLPIAGPSPSRDPPHSGPSPSRDPPRRGTLPVLPHLDLPPLPPTSALPAWPAPCPPLSHWTRGPSPWPTWTLPPSVLPRRPWEGPWAPFPKSQGFPGRLGGGGAPGVRPCPTAARLAFPASSSLPPAMPAPEGRWWGFPGFLSWGPKGGGPGGAPRGSRILGSTDVPSLSQRDLRGCPAIPKWRKLCFCSEAAATDPPPPPPRSVSYCCPSPGQRCLLQTLSSTALHPQALLSAQGGTGRLLWGWEPRASPLCSRADAGLQAFVFERQFCGPKYVCAKGEIFPPPLPCSLPGLLALQGLFACVGAAGHPVCVHRGLCPLEVPVSSRVSLGPHSPRERRHGGGEWCEGCEVQGS